MLRLPAVIQLNKLPDHGAPPYTKPENALRERIKESRHMYEDLIHRYDEVDVFFIKNIFDTKIAELNKLLSEVQKNALINARIIIKGILKPSVTITFAGKSIYLVEDMEDITIKWNGSEIVVEEME